jgi:predicted GH43/DUF377 family glycosyl hydrolase
MTVPVRRSEIRLEPDVTRVVAQLFVAGEELTTGASRASRVMQRVLAMSDEQVELLLDDTLRRFEHRHLGFREGLLAHFEEIGDRLGSRRDLSEARRLLLGAYATNEYSLEPAALCNPSIVAHPDQTGLDAGQVRFVLSLRAVGEGHISSIEFRTGVAGPNDAMDLEPAQSPISAGHLCPPRHDRAEFLALLEPHGPGDELLGQVFDNLPATFSGDELEASIAELHAKLLTRAEVRDSIERIRTVARSNYTVAFPVGTSLSQRVIRPRGPSERNGMEDARFVRFVDDDTVTYYATYTAFDGAKVSPQLLQTDDFATFTVAQLSGPAAQNKGMALFPRRIGGRYVSLSRWDRECNTVAFSDDAHHWGDSVDVQSPEQPWELIQIGNCGSPIETTEGWLIFTHGVGPMRTYSIGALLLDLDDPSKVRGKLREPLLSPDEREREGYVPNVVYTCGALLRDDTIVLPYAYGDRATSVAFIDVVDLLDALCTSPS